jgi:hypothetical protein
MSMRAATRQRGAALLALLAVIALAASWFVVKQLNTESGAIAAARTNRNAAVLNRAKQALIGYIAAQAAKSGEDRPGAFPCPEAPGNFNVAATEGSVSYPCTPPLVGRFPWRSLGLDKLVDTYGEPLWYAVASGWAGANTVINSNCANATAITGMPCAGPAGRLTIDGVTGDVVAIIIAPGPAITASASAGCTAWSQTRPTAAPPDWRNYLECQNATNPADNTFATTGPSGSFNDQVITITASEILPAIEAAIASRIEREIAPVLRTMYSGPYPAAPAAPQFSWSGSPSAPTLPFAASFVDPSTSAMQGAWAQVQGLLPLTYAETAPGSGTLCTPGVAAPRCSPTFVSWSSASMAGGVSSPSCTTTPTQINCTYYYWCLLGLCGLTGSTSVSFTIDATANNVGMAMRQINVNAAVTNIDAGSLAVVTVGGASPRPSISSSSGSATVRLSATATPPAAGSLVSNLLCGISGILSLFFGCAQHTVAVPITLFADHPILDPTATGAGALGWFLRNRWHEVAYYAIAPGFAPSGAKSCVDGTTCLTVANHRTAAGVVDAGKQRAIIVLTGRALAGQARPTSNPIDYLEGANADGNVYAFETRSVALVGNRSFNDRIAVLDSNP